MSLEASILTLAESIAKNTAALVALQGSRPAGEVSDAEAAPEPAPKALTAAEKKAAKKAAEEEAAKAAAAAAEEEGEADADADADPFGDDDADEEPAHTAASIRDLLLKVRDIGGEKKNTAGTQAILKKLGVSTVGQIKEEDYAKAAELANHLLKKAGK